MHCYIPLNLLLYNCKLVNNVNDPILDGIVPAYKLTNYVTKHLINIKCLPLNLLLFNCKLVNEDRNPILDGIVPNLVCMHI